MHRVTVKDVRFSKIGFVMLLESQGDGRVLPVFIAPGEAQSILMRLKGVAPKRPLSHDLMLSLLTDLGAEIRRVVVTALDQETDIYHATILYAVNGQIRSMDARPSDAVALALRCGAPMWVEGDVMDRAGVAPGQIQAVEGSQDEETVEIPVPEPVSDEDLLASLEERLEKAVREERYEDAARLRDRIDELRHTTGK